MSMVKENGRQKWAKDEGGFINIWERMLNCKRAKIRMCRAVIVLKKVEQEEKEISKESVNDNLLCI